jgi:hypothetical protein
MQASRFRLSFGAALLALPLIAASPAEKVERFGAPEAASQALVTAVRTEDHQRLKALFGESGLQDVSSGDPVANRTMRNKFIAAYDAKHSIDAKHDTATLLIGQDSWPFPIPLKRGPQGWFFDVAAGREELLDRRIGANELYTQQVMLAYVDAQNEYAESLHDDLKAHVYAQRLLSSPGKQDGLYWPTEEGRPPSPLGALIAEARAAGYRPGESAEPQPFHGYFFRILKSQGPHAPGGAYDYEVNGLMIGGFGLVAWPARWGNSGVMTFIVNQDGEIYQKDLGPRTPAIAKEMTRFDPDVTWHEVGAPAPLEGQTEEADGGD